MHDGTMHDGTMHNETMHDGLMHDGTMHDCQDDGRWYDGRWYNARRYDGQCTVVEFSTRTPFLIICQSLKFRLLWSWNKHSDMNKCMLWARSGFKTFWLLKMALLGKNLLNFLIFYYIKSTFFGKKREAYGLCQVIF